MPETNSTSTLEQLVSSGVASAPAEHGMPDLVPDHVPEVDDLADTLIADRRRR
ncbi:MAG TPA: hypothetical protein VJ649_04985 [Actinomycetes bacterium]|nr:hypothetical protein [Actinomycetes bacterium]